MFTGTVGERVSPIWAISAVDAAPVAPDHSVLRALDQITDHRQTDLEMVRIVLSGPAVVARTATIGKQVPLISVFGSVCESGDRPGLQNR